MGDTLTSETTLKLYDVHTHLQDRRLVSQRDAVIKRSIDSGVVSIMCCGIHEKDWEEVLVMMESYDAVEVSFGVHPWFINTLSHDWAETLEMLIKKTGAAVGEIGIDRMAGFRNDDEQARVFIRQLDIANKAHRPVNLHCRKAWQMMADILKSNGGLSHGGVVHSWSGSAEMVKVFESLGAHISFSGSLTRPDNKKARAACLSVSKDRLLVETDSPDIIPTGIDSKLNEPAFIHKVVEAVAEIRGETVESVAEYTYENAIRLFGNRSTINP